MIGMDIFDDRAFSAIEMTMAIDRVGFVPGYLSRLSGLLQDIPVRTTKVMIDSRENVPRIVPFSERGAPIPNRTRSRANVRDFRTSRIAEKATVHAHELLDLRAFGRDSVLASVQEEVALRQALVRKDMELTHEYHLLNVVQGYQLDADGSQMYDWYNEWGANPAPTVFFDLLASSPADDHLWNRCVGVNRGIARELEKLGIINPPQVQALCGDAFFDKTVRHPNVTKLYEGHAAFLRFQNIEGRTWRSFEYGDIMFHNYRGTQNGEVAIGTNDVKFFPTGVGIFQRALSPGEKLEFHGTLGREVYADTKIDPDGEWVDFRLRTYPLYVCTVPQALRQGSLGAS